MTSCPKTHDGREPVQVERSHSRLGGSSLDGSDRDSAHALPGASSVASVKLYESLSAPSGSLLDEPAAYWKQNLVSALPTQTQCDMLVSHFFENINYIYQAIHAPSLRAEYALFWATDIADINLIWLALLYMMLCLSSLYIPPQMAEAAGSKSPIWFLCLVDGTWRPARRCTLVFLISQLYWYATNNVEISNSHMGQAVRNAQALGLDKESPPSITSRLEREMRHRIWWDLSLCLGRPPLLQSYLSSVPFPSNCNDVDMTPTSIRVSPISEPTEMSVHYFRARFFKVFNRLFVNNGANLSSYSFIAEIDAEIIAILEGLPWYLQHDLQTVQHALSPNFANSII
ncbi:hypothetical protein TOPH_09142 [Tolypocladium ophioglossoides CBS 100239]|uniref:Xylanolytic transcriptional activator regulatory domain-containing protein n=1 Tax=Tolypocladium ophioglossoides (strain CBS 100239) TaxID=1163406 RepID=A0A0L0MXM8_TOLOC|nr:hypothetical protein TOPH_09142 [Tolypocladium ophioglossoides CBS 100239]